MGYCDYNFVNMFYSGRAISAHANAATKNVADYAYEIYSKDGKYSAQGVSIKEALEEKKWDIVFFQTSPSGAALESEGFEGLDVLIDYIKEQEGNDVKFMWQNSWAYATHDYDPEVFTYNEGRKNESIEKFSDENGEYSQTLMHGMIKDLLVQQFAEGDYAKVIGIDGVIPVGLAVQAARESDVDFLVSDTESFWDMTRDGYHLNRNMGRYIAALTVLRQLKGIDLVYTDGIYNVLVDGTATKEQLRAAIDIVNGAFLERDALVK